ncbi:hypothetical protein LUU34_00596100 [Aix galericulata]|nr:hypothetical protein LUU34_00596100 [Aix galericulata]
MSAGCPGVKQPRARRGRGTAGGGAGRMRPSGRRWGTASTAEPPPRAAGGEGTGDLGCRGDGARGCGHPTQPPPALSSPPKALLGTGAQGCQLRALSPSPRSPGGGSALSWEAAAAHPGDLVAAGDRPRRLPCPVSPPGPLHIATEPPRGPGPGTGRRDGAGGPLVPLVPPMSPCPRSHPAPLRLLPRCRFAGTQDGSVLEGPQTPNLPAQRGHPNIGDIPAVAWPWCRGGRQQCHTVSPQPPAAPGSVPRALGRSVPWGTCPHRDTTGLPLSPSQWGSSCPQCMGQPPPTSAPHGAGCAAVCPLNLWGGYLGRGAHRALAPRPLPWHPWHPAHPQCGHYSHPPFSPLPPQGGGTPLSPLSYPPPSTRAASRAPRGGARTLRGKLRHGAPGPPPNPNSPLSGRHGSRAAERHFLRAPTLLLLLLLLLLPKGVGFLPPPRPLTALSAAGSGGGRDAASPGSQGCPSALSPGRGRQRDPLNGGTDPGGLGNEEKNPKPPPVRCGFAGRILGGAGVGTPPGGQGAGDMGTGCSGPGKHEDSGNSGAVGSAHPARDGPMGAAGGPRCHPRCCHPLQGLSPGAGAVLYGPHPT